MSNRSPRRHRTVCPLTLGLIGCLAAVAGCSSPCLPANAAVMVLPTTAPATAGTAPHSNPPSTQPATTTRPADAKWRPLFDGKTLGDWKASGFGGQGDPEVADGTIVLPSGEALTGVTWGGADVPKTNYEVSLEAQRVNGGDFFCGLTFPVADSHATLVLGGWGGTVCGISSLNGDDASANETTQNIRFESERWYRVRVRVTPDRLRAWLDEKKIVDVVTAEKQIDVRPDIAESKPLGISSFRTTAAVRDIKIRDLEPDERGAGK